MIMMINTRTTIRERTNQFYYRQIFHPRAIMPRERTISQLYVQSITIFPEISSPIVNDRKNENREKFSNVVCKLNVDSNVLIGVNR